MSYRGPALQYRIRKTTINNKTGDSYAITIPKFIAQKFEEVLFRLAVSGNTIVFESGCKITVDDVKVFSKRKIVTAGGIISF